VNFFQKRISWFACIYTQNMFVVAHQNEIGDDIFHSYHEMAQMLIKIPDSVGYQYYPLNGGWIIGRKYIADGDEILYYEHGTWPVPLEYRTYSLPNRCSNCKLDNYMQGTICLFCTLCLDCEKPSDKCLCPYNDY